MNNSSASLNNLAKLLIPLLCWIVIQRGAVALDLLPLLIRYVYRTSFDRVCVLLVRGVALLPIPVETIN